MTNNSRYNDYGIIVKESAKRPSTNDVASFVDREYFHIIKWEFDPFERCTNWLNSIYDSAFRLEMCTKIKGNFYIRNFPREPLRLFESNVKKALNDQFRIDRSLAKNYMELYQKIEDPNSLCNGNYIRNILLQAPRLSAEHIKWVEHGYDVYLFQRKRRKSGLK